MNIFSICKNASTTTRRLCFSYTGGPDVVVLREPFDRFISAAKTVHPIYGIFGGFPPTFENMPRDTGSFPNDATAKDIVDNAIQNLGKIDYLKTQKFLIGNRKFDEVIRFNNYKSDLENIMKKYKVSFVGEVNLDEIVNKSPIHLDVELKIYAESNYLTQIQEFFTDDYALWNDYTEILKS